MCKCYRSHGSTLVLLSRLQLLKRSYTILQALRALDRWSDTIEETPQNHVMISNESEKHTLIHTHAWAPSCTCQRPPCWLRTTCIQGDKRAWERERRLYPILISSYLIHQHTLKTQINTRTHSYQGELKGLDQVISSGGGKRCVYVFMIPKSIQQLIHRDRRWVNWKTWRYMKTVLWKACFFNKS